MNSVYLSVCQIASDVQWNLRPRLIPEYEKYMYIWVKCFSHWIYYPARMRKG